MPPIGEGTEGRIFFSRQRLLVDLEAGGVGGESVGDHREEGMQDSFFVAEAEGEGRKGGREGGRVSGGWGRRRGRLSPS